MNKSQTIQELRDLYCQFLQIHKSSLIVYVRNANNTDGTNNLTDQAIGKAYGAYYRPPFFVFLRDLKTAMYSPSIFECAKTIAKDSEYIAGFAELFAKTKIAKLDTNGKAVSFREDLLGMLPRVRGEDEIKSIIERKLGVRVKASAPATDLIRHVAPFTTKSKFDQLPISQASAIFEVKKILENLPLPGTFLFVGDDDFISV